MLAIILFLSITTLSNINNLEVEKWENKKHYNPDIYYNLGVYYTIHSNTGKAILNLKRANTLAPNDKQIKELLDTHRRKLDIPVIEYEPSFIEKVFSSPFTLLSINEMVILSLILISFGSIVITLNLIFLIKIRFLERFLKNKKTIISSLIIFIIGIIYYIGAVIRYNITFDKNAAIVIEKAAIYDSPESDAIKIYELEEGTEVKIKEKNKAFYLIETLNKKEGYISTNSLERVWK